MQPHLALWLWFRLKGTQVEGDEPSGIVKNQPN